MNTLYEAIKALIYGDLLTYMFEMYAYVLAYIDSDTAYMPYNTTYIPAYTGQNT